MAFITADRVRDTSTSTSTGNFTVSGTAPTGFRTLSAVLAANDTFYYAIQHQTLAEWEVGIGTYTSTANQFARTTVLSSSNAGSAVNFSAGTKDVFLTLAAGKTVQVDGSGAPVNLGTLPIANGGTGSTTLAGANIPVTTANNTFTGTQTFSGTSSVIAAVFSDIAEPATISATAATGTINYDVTTQSILYYTSNASANWTVNFRGSSGTSLNTLMTTGQIMTVAFLVTQGATAYYNSAVQVDGSSVTPKWQGGAAPTSGNASSIDVYTYTIVKTGSAAFTVFASQTRFA